ncbi:Alpha-D-glucose-1-phosphate phosphatase YihX [Cytospora mali]|uniref:Alpha-D-glucose-1-phosphate phosphatase YihX n=1 Tax=Cytospora mali TaxID=578113 RepID=A0A194W2B2_CYTMA|nr:Alpha-D-glucose-1-phosphate phosphatase YihX [Valsa mali]
MYSLQAPPRGIIFDLGDVLFTWSANTTTTIPARKLRDILSTPVWHSYERGEITRDACYDLSAQQFSLPATEIAEAFAQARKSLQADPVVVSFLRELKKDPAIKVYAMSNIGKEDFEEVEAKMDWLLFDQVFTSAAAGTRKPELGFYRHVLDHIGLAGNQVVFIDDKEENLDTARTLGIRGYVFGDSTVPMLREMLESPVGRGWRYLYQNADQCVSITDSGVAFADNFAKLLIVDTLKDQTLVDLSWGSRETWNFFAGKIALIPGGVFPDDLDTTALALRALRPPAKTVSPVLDKMAEYVNDDGTFQTYYCLDKLRVDPVVSANILACFYTYNRGHEFERTIQLVHSMLSARSYMHGTRYYSSPDCCLGFIGRLLRSSNDDHLHMTLGSLLKSRVRERLGIDSGALDLAMRIITCDQMGIPCEDDRRVLLSLQCEDGSWEGGWLYQYGSTGMKIGNRGVTTAMAVAALSSPGIPIHENSASK